VLQSLKNIGGNRIHRLPVSASDDINLSSSITGHEKAAFAVESNSSRPEADVTNASLSATAYIFHRQNGNRGISTGWWVRWLAIGESDGEELVTIGIVLVPIFGQIRLTIVLLEVGLLTSYHATSCMQQCLWS
jgi:hypothetical protein